MGGKYFSLMVWSVRWKIEIWNWYHTCQHLITNPLLKISIEESFRGWTVMVGCIVCCYCFTSHNHVMVKCTEWLQCKMYVMYRNICEDFIKCPIIVSTDTLTIRCAPRERQCAAVKGPIEVTGNDETRIVAADWAKWWASSCTYIWRELNCRNYYTVVTFMIKQTQCNL